MQKACIHKEKSGYKVSETRVVLLTKFMFCKVRAKRTD